MKTTGFKKLFKINEALINLTKNKKELILERSEKLDPNNKDIQRKPLLKSGTKRELHDDGFEHRSSKETTDAV